MKCAQCGKDGVITDNQEQTIPYGVEKKVNIRATVPVRICNGCGFEGLDCEAEQIIQDAIDRHLEGYL
jgi:hypothetical protein